MCLITYNHVDLLESTLRSILNQTIAGYEVVVSDDCSTDGTWELILELAAKDARIKPIRTTHNLGMPGNANFAVASTSKPYVALLHHDDLYRGDLLEKWVNVLERHPDATFVFNPYGIFESPKVHSETMPGEYMNGKWFLARHLFPKWGCVVRGTAMIRRDAWQRVGGMREKFGLLADVDLWMRLAGNGAVGYVPDPVITIRQNRPRNYPDLYKPIPASFWPRQRILYEVHAINRLEMLDLNKLSGRLQWWAFRLKLTLETIKWLAYSVIRKNREMIATSRESVTPYDLWPLFAFRGFIGAVSGTNGSQQMSGR